MYKDGGRGAGRETDTEHPRYPCCGQRVPDDLSVGKSEENLIRTYGHPSVRPRKVCAPHPRHVGAFVTPRDRAFRPPRPYVACRFEWPGEN